MPFTGFPFNPAAAFGGPAFSGAVFGAPSFGNSGAGTGYGGQQQFRF